jgi:tetratricopeptide (TPR) repeat protein
MDKLKVKYATYSKATPPQPIRVKVPGWAGSPEHKMEDGSPGQPWHCLPFVEASTYGLELINPFEPECQIINDNGMVRIELDFSKESGGELTGAEFSTFYPKQSSKHYHFTTRIDVQAPPGHAIRTEPHPRFFTDDTQTCPLAVIGHLQTEWWPRKLFVVFKVPPPGQRHLFRKGEAYAQIIFVPKRAAYELVKLTAEEEASRRKLDTEVEMARLQIADNVWHNSSGYQLSNHYKTLAAAFSRDGPAAVEETIQKAVERHAAALPKGKTVAEYLAMASERLNQEKYDEAREIYTHVLSLDANNADAFSHLGICMACKGLSMSGLQLMARAVAIAPMSPVYHGNMGELLRMMGKLPEAENCFRAALQLVPNDPGYMSVLGQILVQEGKAAEGLEMCRTAARIGINNAAAQFRLGMVLAQQKQYAQARGAFEAALTINPSFGAARQALLQLPQVP